MIALGVSSFVPLKKGSVSFQDYINDEQPQVLGNLAHWGSLVPEGPYSQEEFCSISS